MYLHRCRLLGGFLDSQSWAQHLGAHQGSKRPPGPHPEGPRLVSTNFFYLCLCYFLRALYCIFTCRNSILYYIDIGLGVRAGRPSTGGLGRHPLPLPGGRSPHLWGGPTASPSVYFLFCLRSRPGTFVCVTVSLTVITVCALVWTGDIMGQTQTTPLFLTLSPFLWC